MMGCLKGAGLKLILQSGDASQTIITRAVLEGQPTDGRSTVGHTTSTITTLEGKPSCPPFTTRP